MTASNHPKHARPSAPTHALPGAFTLVELLLTIAIIALLVGILVPSLSYGLVLCRQARELKTAGSVMTAYTLYAHDHKGTLMPGYAPLSMTLPPGTIPNQPVLNVRDELGGAIHGQTARRYPWRLAPYMNYQFAGLYDGTNLLERYQARPDQQYVLSISPALGINADFVGGKSDPGLGFDSDARARFGDFYLTRLDGSRRPAEVIVFASARGVDPDSTAGSGVTVPGFHLVDAPVLTASRWSAAPFDKRQPPERWGYVDARFGGRAVAVHLDSHGTPYGIDDLRDMRRWSDRATGATWALGM